METEIVAAAEEIKRHRMHVEVVERYELPEGFGTRTVVEMTRYARTV